MSLLWGRIEQRWEVTRATRLRHTAWGGILCGAAHLWHIDAGAYNAINPSFSQL